MADNSFRLLRNALIGNPAMLDSISSMRAVLSDVFFDKAVINQYLSAMNFGIVQLLVEHPARDSFFINSLYLKMQSNTGYPDEIAKRTIDAWLS